MAEDTMLKEAVDAISKGQRARARDLLTRLLRADQKNPEYWLWMSSVVETENERVYCLESALRHDPANIAARRGLILLGARRPGDEVKPVPMPKRRFALELTEDDEPKTGFQKIWANRKYRYASLGGVAVFLVLLFAAVFFSYRAAMNARIAALPPTRDWRTPLVMQPTSTYLPTPTPVVKSPTPTYIGPTPLWMKLEATYTPVPLYVTTPHAIIDAYRLGLRAYYSGDYPKMLDFMRQASQVDPDAADLQYFLGEAFRLVGDYTDALDAFNRAIALDPNFASAYLGRGRVWMATGSQEDIAADIQKALELDPNLVDAYLARADYFIRQQDPDSALEDLETAGELAPDRPQVYLYRSQAYFLLGEVDEALQNAEKAYELDMTSLPTYLALGKAAFAAGDHQAALDSLNTYLLYENMDPEAWILKGRILLADKGSVEEALAAFDRALEMGEVQASVYYYRALAYIDLKDGKSAVNDLMNALKAEPKSYEINLQLGIALRLAGRPGDSLRQFTAAESYAEEDRHLAEVYYWRAQVLEELEEKKAAVDDWQALLALEDAEIPEAWIKAAEAHLEQLLTPTPTSTQSVEPSRTPAPTKTQKPTSTPKATSTRKATPTKTAKP